MTPPYANLIDLICGAIQYFGFRYLLNLPGNGYASRLRYLMRCGSVPIFYDNGIEEFWYHAMEVPFYCFSTHVPVCLLNDENHRRPLPIHCCSTSPIAAARASAACQSPLYYTRHHKAAIFSEDSTQDTFLSFSPQLHAIICIGCKALLIRELIACRQICMLSSFSPQTLIMGKMVPLLFGRL